MHSWWDFTQNERAGATVVVESGRLQQHQQGNADHYAEEPRDGLAHFTPVTFEQQQRVDRSDQTDRH